jgi:hypothetical protein
MRKRKGLKEQVPGYDNVSFWYTVISLRCVANTFHSTTTSCKNVPYPPDMFSVSHGCKYMFMRLTNPLHCL